MPLVRQAGVADEAALFDLLMEIHRQGLGKAFPYDTEKVQAAIRLGTRRRGGIIGIIDAPDQPGVIAGSVAMTVDCWWWSTAAFLQLRWLFVLPVYRRGFGYADALMAWAEGCRRHMQRDIGYPMLLESSFVNDDPRRVELMHRWWRRWGRHVGGVYLGGL